MRNSALEWNLESYRFIGEGRTFTSEENETEWNTVPFHVIDDGPVDNWKRWHLSVLLLSSDLPLITSSHWGCDKHSPAWEILGSAGISLQQFVWSQYLRLGKFMACEKEYERFFSASQCSSTCLVPRFDHSFRKPLTLSERMEMFNLTNLSKEWWKRRGIQNHVRHRA